MGSCNQPGFEAIEVLDVEGQPSVVCGLADAYCGDDGACAVPCEADSDCSAPGASTCDRSSGRCICASDDDCTASGLGDLCVDGQCRCTDDAFCQAESPFLGGMMGCLGLDA